MIEVNACEVSTQGATLLQRVSFVVSEGQVLIVRGANGAGKSTLLACISGTLTPTHGQVTVGGLIASAADRRFRQVVASSLAPPPTAHDLTVSDHLHLVALSWHPNGRAAGEAVERVHDELGMDHLLGKFPGELSAGQGQVFSLACTLVRPSGVLVLDEPEHRLDGDRLANLAEVLHQRVKDGVTLVVATHSDELQGRLGGQVLHLETAGGT